MIRLGRSNCLINQCVFPDTFKNWDVTYSEPKFQGTWIYFRVHCQWRINNYRQIITVE